MLKIKGFKFAIGDVIVPKSELKDVAHFLHELVIEDIHPEYFFYTVIDMDGEFCQISPLMIENDFMLKGECNNASRTSGN